MAANLGIPVEDALVRLGYISAADLGQAQAAEFGYEYIELEGRQIPNAVIELVTESMARENIVLPIESDGESVVIAMHNPNNIEVIDKLRIAITPRLFAIGGEGFGPARAQVSTHMLHDRGN